MLKIDVRGVADTIKQVEKDYRDFLKELAEDIRVNAAEFTPVRTGKAQRNWRKKVADDNFEVYNPVPYVPYLEKGTEKMKPANKGKGIIGPALSQVKGKYK